MPDNIGYQEISPQTVVPAGYTGIYTIADLESVAGDMTGNYIQMADIDLSGYGDWEIIVGPPRGLLEGIYDGNGYSIRGLSGSGLFTGTFPTGVIKNLKIIDADLGGEGAIITNHQEGKIENCYVSGICRISNGCYHGDAIIKNCTAEINITPEQTIITPPFAPICRGLHDGAIIERCSSFLAIKVNTNVNVGGLIVSAFDSKISDCTVVINAEINCSESDIGMIGGLLVQASDTLIDSCQVTGSMVSTAGNIKIGGLVALSYDTEITFSKTDVNIETENRAGGFVCETYGSTEISNCCSRGTVIAGEIAGGFAGGSWDKSKISGCYAFCDVTGKNQGDGCCVGGFVGYSLTSLLQNCYSLGDVALISTGMAGYIGGFVGQGDSDFVNCYAVGKLIHDETPDIGGFMGWKYEEWSQHGGSITNCYFDATLSGMPDDGKGKPKTTEQLKQRKTYQNWDFTNIWVIDPLLNYGYPYLQGSSPPPLPGIAFELIFGPVTFGISHLEKRVRKVSLVVSKEPDAVMLVSTSASDVGDFAFEKEVAAGQGLDMRKIYLPMAQGNPSGGLAYRVRIRGIGRVQIHDISFDVSVRRAW